MRFECNISALGYHNKTVLRDVRLTAEEGELIAVVGRNGSGKSTLLSALCGLLPYTGEVRVDGRELGTLSPRERATLVSLMAQRPRAPHVTVEQLLSFGRAPYRSFAQSPDEADKQAVERAMQLAELETLRACRLDRLSGGELRRAYFGMLLAQDTPLLLADEATAFMDMGGEQRFLDVLRTLCRERHKTVISVTHSLEQAVHLADRIAVLHGGTLHFFGTPEAFLQTDIPERVFAARRYMATDADGRRRIFFSTQE